MQSRHPDVGKKHRMELGTPDALAGPLFSSGPNMKLSPGTRQSPEGRCWDHLSNKHVLRPLDTVLSTGRPASASRNSLALHDRGDLEAWPTHCPAGEGVPSRKGAAGSVTALATAGGGPGKAAKWWDLGAESVSGTTSPPLCSHHAGFWPPSTTGQLGASVSSSITFQGNYIIDKGVVLRYVSPLHERTQNNKRKNDHFAIPRTNNGWRPGSSVDDKTTSERLMGNLIRDGSGRRGKPTVKINVTKTGHWEF